MTTMEPVVRTAPGGSSLRDVVEVILDKGIVIDAYVRVSLVGIELLTVDARVVISSVDTYLRYAEAVNRLDLRRKSEAVKLSDIVSGPGSMGEDMGEGAMDEFIEKVSAKLPGGGDDKDDKKDK